MKHQKKITLLIVLICVALFIVYHYDLKKFLYSEEISFFVETHSILSPFVFIILFCLFVILLLPASILTIIAGGLFGSFLGLFYSMVGIAIGSAIAFYIARKLGRKSIEKLIHTRFKKVHEYNEKISHNAFMAVFIVRLTPFTPFKTANYIFGLTQIKTKTYLLATITGMIPETFVLVFFGDSILNFSIKKLMLSLFAIALLFGCTWLYLKSKKNNYIQVQ